MQHKIKILATLLAASVSANTFAAQEVLNGAFTTIKAVTISEVTPISFIGLTLTANDTCVMSHSADGSGQDYLGDIAMRLGSGELNAAGTEANLMDSCTGAGTAAFGVYEIDGAAGSTVNVTIANSVTTGDVSVVPTGCVGDYDGGSNGDTCEALAVATNGGVTAVQLAGVGDITTLGEGTPIAGTSLISLGGTVKAENNLTAGTPYTVDFTIDVTY